MKQKLKRQERHQGKSVAKMPEEAAQTRRKLTHMPYASRCKERVEHRARPDRHERTDGVYREEVILSPDVSFDFCYKRARDSVTKSARAVCWLVTIDSQTGFIHVAPLRSKNQVCLIARELMNFSQLLWYSAIAYRSDNEPTTRQTLEMLINARHSPGLTARSIISKIGDHSFLSENAADRVRKLAGTFIEGMQSRLGTKIGSDHAIRTWAARHASWVLNRFQPVKGANPYELVYRQE